MRGLYALKPWYTRRLNRFVDGAVKRGLSPDLFTFIGIFGALAAALAIAIGWAIPAAVFLAVRLAGANLDGGVARARGVSRPWGFVLNEIGDRLSDFLMFAGLAVLAATTAGGLATPEVLWVVAAAAAATLPTFISLSAAGASATRRNGGPLGKTERCLAVVIATALPAWIIPISIILIAGSLLTAILRVSRAHRELSATAAVTANKAAKE